MGEDSSLLVSKRGEAERLTELLGCCLGHSGVAKSESTFLCVLPMWIFRPFSDLKLFSHWSHLKTFSSSGSASFSGVVSIKEGSLSGGGPCFLDRNSALLLEFLLLVDGLFLFFDKVDEPSPLVSKENVKEGPTLRVKLKVCPLLASAWQKAMHWEAKSEFSSLIVRAAIFSYI